MKKLIAFSGMKPSGRLTLGNYLGVIRRWIEIQDNYECIFCIADLHAITVRNKSKTLLRQLSFDMLALYLSCGLDPYKNIIFIQSHVLEHSQLNWILNCYAYFGEVNRMIQFKEKSVKYGKNINIGLFNYPILMASDVLLYQTNLVPVGEDQKQHLELIRNIAKRFNSIYGEVFSIPEIFVFSYGSRIMSLSDPTKKMSKSNFDYTGVIDLLDDINAIKYKIMKSVTDSDNPPLIKFDRVNKPGISNLLEIFSSIANVSIKVLEDQFVGKTYFQLKKEIIKLIIPIITEIQRRYFFLRSDENFLCKVLSYGQKKAKILANITIQKVYESIGFLKDL